MHNIRKSMMKNKTPCESLLGSIMDCGVLCVAQILSRALVVANASAVVQIAAKEGVMY
jgi:hypothetical protein